MPDDPMSIYLGKDAPPSMLDFENLERYRARMKAVEKHVKRLKKLQLKANEKNLLKQKDRREILFHRDLIGIALDAIKDNCYFERPFVDTLLETAEIILIAN